ncbi:unnamed protein product [Arabidopsis thaliana]|jgi:hypothetical protein|uniref:NDR1/HIN1-like protein 10 n=2 Tax=Arabidopsis thaliana TaxID=3702 RepID=NHL10_ARATH|nr:Late embryogenesis abundant (LEA) hydroxyproline-rich glycoprotein family [Arabidopsis thaliana]Q9SJ52.1 RecName: Full=NDR1/HIN1-like protein 10; Short=AtNHL10; AltName: Full=Protein YELLOW-LEAF-SPECIFIC GENE 9 [Arabidopsis thaliana]AAD21459.1 similar to harpin-induced protein hin1 from tobacco [Arabidopsis thaliana]AAM63691.1 similar to harpin-induced protein hin1 from tobacco [Arabidopsis thaliana]AAO22692.1 putative harpin-induced protein hin1 [Arabidopsis thaliana]AAO42394.1 putative ha|eukprot:NP_181142.1 Late embryogenesis abundant (LEA) hydroxyproline-rich glycoprotein family [Arabidopsis thaliana]
MAAEQPLNGAFYGPSVPPPAPKGYYRRGHGRGCGCCLLSLFVKVIISLIVILGVAALIFWLIVRPRAIKFHVTDASLTRFDHTSPDNILRYNLALTVPVRNPNKRIGLYYDRIEAHAYYEGKRFSTITLTPFYQGHKNTTVLTPTFQGQNLVIFNAGQSRTLNAERISGVYNIEIKFRLRVRFKLGDLKFRRIKPKVDCDDLRLPLSTSNGTTTTSTVFPIKCDFDF